MLAKQTLNQSASEQWHDEPGYVKPHLMQYQIPEIELSFSCGFFMQMPKIHPAEQASIALQALNPYTRQSFNCEVIPFSQSISIGPNVFLNEELIREN